MDWEVFVNGPEPVLAQLAEVLGSSDPSLVGTPDGFVLRFGRFDGSADASDVRDSAREIVAALSMFARLQLHSTAQLEVGGVVQVTPDGRRNYFIQPLAGNIKLTGGLVSMIVTRADGTVEEHRPAGLAPAWLSKALSNPEMQRAMRLRDIDDPSWTDLYRLFEIIQSDVGGEAALVATGWTSRDTLRKFRHSANSVEVAGDEARHGVEVTSPPKHPMPLSEARSFVDGLLRQWLGD